MTSIADPNSSPPNEPRSSRVGPAGPPTTFSLSPRSSTDDSSSPLTPPLSSPPLLPPRSPLRPGFRRQSEPVPNTSETNGIIEHTQHDMDPLTSPRSFTSFSGLAESPTRPRSKRAKTPDKPLPPPPPSPRPPPSPVSLHQIDVVRPQPRTRASTLLDPPPVISKRTHALLELLGSERAYASDLALIRDIHQPLALGQTLPFATAPPTPPSSGSSSRTLSTASDSSTSSAHGAPMTKDDVRIIFNNVADIAVFSDRFTTRLEEALGNVLEGGNGEDHVGALFLEVIPEMEPLYTLYITKHPTALEHLSNLPTSPALTDYLAHTRTLAQSLTHAWDLPSLLIKPVQRLLKYSLLLGAIIDETPDTHGDKENLKRARERMEAVAHGVNEGRRRREVVKEVLTGVPPKKLGEQQKVKKKGLNVSVSASVNLGRMKSLRASTSSSVSSLLSRGNANDEAAKVSKWGEELRETDAFIRHIANQAVAWGSAIKVVTEKLKEWAEAFGAVIGVEPGRASDAFDALHNLVALELFELSTNLDELIETRFIKELTNLRDTTDAPERLLEAMYTLEPLHNGLLNINVAKNRPSPQLLEASKSYLALRGQLYEELPRYLQLLHKGVTRCLLDLATVQTEFWMHFRKKWGNLWDALKVDGETQGEAAETLRVWWGRFEEIELRMGGLNILQPPKRDDRDRRASQQREVASIRETPVKPTRRKRATSNSLDMSSTHSIMSVTSVLAALDPFHTPPPPKASPSKSRSMQSLDSMSLSTSLSTSTRRDRKNSTESLRSRKSGKSIKIGKSPQYHSMSNLNDPFEGGSIVYDLEFSPEPIYPPSPTRPSYNRTTSMPISYPQPLKKSASQGRLLEIEVESSASSTRSLLNHTPDLDGFLGPAGSGDFRGRPTRKPSFRRRLTDHFRQQGQQAQLPSYPGGAGVGGMVTPPATNSKRRSSPSPPPERAEVDPRVLKRMMQEAVAKPPLYECEVVFNCEPPEGVEYMNYGFFTLIVGDVYGVVLEAGHPSNHADLPLYVDDGEDCVLLVRNAVGEDGWALASFLRPVD